jgi:cytochrome P450
MRLTSSPVRLPTWVPSPTNVRLRKALRRLDRSLAAIVTERESGVEALSELGDVLSLLLGARPHLDRRELLDELATLVMSGYETSADALSWLVFCLYSDPELLARVRKPVLADPGSVEAEEMVGACVKECLRLWPPAWITTREAMSDVRLRDYTVPAGTTLALSPWVTQRDPRWYDEPTTYAPERWLTSEDRPRYAYFPFGGGERSCIGTSLAMRELQITAARLLSSVDLELLAPDGVRPRPALALQPVGLRAVVRAARPKGDV